MSACGLSGVDGGKNDRLKWRTAEGFIYRNAIFTTTVLLFCRFQIVRQVFSSNISTVDVDGSWVSSLAD
jgi:hypothetical protein